MTYQQNPSRMGFERKNDDGKGKPIDMTEVKSAFERLNKGFEEFKQANDEASKEFLKKGDVDTLLEGKMAKINADMNAHQKLLDQFELSMKRNPVKYLDADGNEIDMEAKAQSFARAVGMPKDEAKGFTYSDLEAYGKTMDRYLRKGEVALSVDETKALSVGSDPDGGYTVHPDMNGRVVDFVYESSPMRAYASVAAISTSALEGIVDIDQAGFEWVGEQSTRSVTTTPQIERWSIPVHELSAMPKATQRLLDDSEWNIEAWLAEKVADRFGRAEAAAFVTGTGINQPRGFLDYGDWTTAGTHERGALEQFDTGVNGAFAAAPSGGDVLITALYALKQQHRNNAVWFMNRATTSLARKLKDSDGAYLWNPGIAAGQPATILGYPTASFEDMPDPATGSLSIAVGDMRRTYQIVDRTGIRVLRDPFTAKPHVLFYTTKRVGGDVVDFDALKIINFKA